MKNWVILSVRTGSEEKLVRVLKEKLRADEYLPFLPAKETFHRSQSVYSKKRSLLFPGYIFIQTMIYAESIARSLKTALTALSWPKDIIKILHYGDNENDVAVRVRERFYWERLFDSDFCVTGSVGFIEGDNLRVTSGPLIGMEGQIKKINRHKRKAIVEMEMMGAVRRVKVMLEVVGGRWGRKKLDCIWS